MAKNNKIHVAYGFHVNCYHSYRGDTNDGLGFGSDIRIIRKIISVLNDFNRQGVPVKATWDIENFFSLEKILPEYAPDIIEGIKKRVVEYGDENIIMGYSNGALSAMNEAEFTASIKLAVSNEQGSGLKDVFGECEMIVRPQEVMFTPSQVSLYNKCGVKALSLYYSCVPFDAFKTIVPVLPDEQAFNPLTYTYKGESLTVIPTYNNSDICDAGCLRAWVKELHQKQENDIINSDLLLFINMDADAIFWETMNLPVVGSRIANTDGIHGLVFEIADLPYIVFDTPGGYLKNHHPIGKIGFTQDTADGNFTGYASWSEKPYNRKIWTALERSRAMAKLNSESDEKSASFTDRVLLLSTTHFGLATPMLNIQREEKANALASSVVESELKLLPKGKSYTVNNITGSSLQCFQIASDDVSGLAVIGDDVSDYTVIPMSNGTAFAVIRFGSVKESYNIEFTHTEKKHPGSCLSLEAGNTKIEFSSNTGISAVYSSGKKIGGSDFLKSYITYDKQRYDFSVLGVNPVWCSGTGKCVRVSGCVHIPGEISGGTFNYDFFTIESSDIIFVNVCVNYPHTPEHDSNTTENSTLGRFYDRKWSEAVPFELNPVFCGDLSVIKRNFMDDISAYRLKSFVESDPVNRKLDSFNHQLTAGLVGVGSDEGGFLIANSRQVLNSMAHCPMRLDSDGKVHINPFGTYYGKQRHHIGRANDEILATYTLVTPQGKSIAPSYNGVSENFVLGLLGYDGKLDGNTGLSDLLSFADGAVTVAPDGSSVKPFFGDNVKFPETQKTGEDGTKLRNPVLNGISGNIGNYITKGSKAILHIITNQIKAAKE